MTAEGERKANRPPPVIQRSASERPPALQRSASANWASLRRVSKRTAAMKEKYDEIQTEKRTRSPAPVIRVESIKEEEGGGEEEEEEGAGERERFLLRKLSQL